MTNKQAKQVIELLNTIDISIYSADELLEAEIEDVDQLEEWLQENEYFDVEIIYHARAMEYLAEHDPSLQLSIGIASDMGCELSSINSELLASLLAGEVMREEFAELREELEEIIEAQA